MKRILIIIIIVIGAVIFRIPEYVELNNLAIIESIGVQYENRKYTIYLKEIIPKKDENGINYDYKYYKSQEVSLKDAYKKLPAKTKKKLYYNDVKALVLNIEKSNKVMKLFKIKPKKIIHIKDNVYKELKDI